MSEETILAKVWVTRKDGHRQRYTKRVPKPKPRRKRPPPKGTLLVKRWVTKKDGHRQRYKKRVKEEDIEEDDELLEGYKRIVEWLMHWDYPPSGKPRKPSDLRSWTIRIQLPEGQTEEDMRKLGEDIMWSYVSDELISASTFEFEKKGVDIIEYSTSDRIRYKVVDAVRPQYTYPKKRKWGSWKK